MKFNINILSESEAINFYKDYNEESKCLLISITEEHEDVAFGYKENVIVFRTHFSDIEKEVPTRKLTLMKFSQALELKCIIDEAIKLGIVNIIVHCKAGISRSGAVGCVLARYLNKSDSYLWKYGNIHPNKWVYRLMCEAFNLEYSEKDFKYKQRISKKVLDKRFSDYGISVGDMFK